MKNLYLKTALAFLIVLCASCSDKQKASPRVAIWGEENNDSTELASLSAKKVLIPFVRTDENLAQIQISLNGEPFNMLWDTGATLTSISALELEKLAKEGKIELDDIQGSVVERIADGSTTESLVINIREIHIPGRNNQYLILHDVDATVSPNAEAPLLIGQNIIQNLPTHIFHEAEGVIEFEQQ